MSLGRAQKLMRQGRFTEAEAALATDSRRFDPRRGIVLARICEASGDSDRALRILDQNIETVPSHAPSHLFRGIAFLDRGQTVEALAAFDHVLEIQPVNALAHAYRGLVLLQLGRDEEGLAALRQHGFSDNAMFMVRLTEWVEGEWLRNGRFFSRHEVVSTQAVEQPSGRARVSRRAAERHFFAKRYAALLRELEPIVREEDPDPDLIYGYAIAAEMLKDYAAALRAVAALAGQDTLPDPVRALRARNMLRQGEIEVAAQELGRVLIIGPEDYGVNYFLGILCLAHGDRTRARQLFFRSYTEYLVDTLEYQFWQLQRTLLGG